jgi:hypothetical protein
MKIMSLYAKGNILVVYSEETFNALNTINNSVFFLSRNHSEYQLFPQFSDQMQPDKIEKLLKKYFFIYERWNGGSDYQRFIKDFQIQVSKLANYLNDLNISVIYMPTCSPHHFDTLLFCIISEILKIKVVYFYRTVFKNTYIPTIQCGPFEERRILQDWNENKNACNDFIDFRANLKQNNDPEGQMERNGYNTRLSASIVYTVFYLLRRKIGQIFKKNKLSFLEVKYVNYSIFKNLFFLFNQRKYLKEIQKKYVVPNGKGILFYANFQPEATSFPEAIPHDDMLAVLRKLRTANPNIAIYFKEHPSTAMFFEKGHGPTKVGLVRNREFVLELKRLSVKIVDPRDFSPEGLTEICVNGTVALEKYIQKRSVLTLVDNWFTQLFNIDTGLEQLESSISGKLFHSNSKKLKHHEMEKKLKDSTFHFRKILVKKI